MTKITKTDKPKTKMQKYNPKPKLTGMLSAPQFT